MVCRNCGCCFMLSLMTSSNNFGFGCCFCASQSHNYFRVLENSDFYNVLNWKYNWKNKDLFQWIVFFCKKSQLYGLFSSSWIVPLCNPFLFRVSQMTSCTCLNSSFYTIVNDPKVLIWSPCLPLKRLKWLPTSMAALESNWVGFGLPRIPLYRLENTIRCAAWPMFSASCNWTTKLEMQRKAFQLQCLCTYSKLQLDKFL